MGTSEMTKTLEDLRAGAIAWQNAPVPGADKAAALRRRAELAQAAADASSEAEHLEKQLNDLIFKIDTRADVQVRSYKST